MAFERFDRQLWPSREDYPTLEEWADALVKVLGDFDDEMKTQPLIDRPPLHIVGDPGEPAYNATWSGAPNATFRIDELGIVEMNTGTLSTVAIPAIFEHIFTLPARFIPERNIGVTGNVASVVEAALIWGSGSGVNTGKLMWLGQLAIPVINWTGGTFTWPAFE